LQALHLVRPGRVLSLLYGSEVLRFQQNPFCRWLARRFFCRADEVATISQFSKSLIARSGLLPASQNIIIAPCACSSAAARPVAATNAKDNKIRILTLARIDQRKGQLDTACALAALPSDLRNKIIYQIGGCGDIRYQHAVEKVCRDAGVAFEFFGSIDPDRLPALYKECDIYAMTSRVLRRSVEGFGITYLEAGFHGKPVVGYRSAGAIEAVIDGETGLLVAEGDIGGLTDAFARLISDSELRDRLGRKGREHAARFSWDATARILLTAAGVARSP
jgi:phosphatidylinositol alpha-1,6-mannosyltransferase